VRAVIPGEDDVTALDGDQSYSVTPDLIRGPALDPPPEKRGPGSRAG